MLEKVARSGLIVYLYYNRDAKKLATIGDIVYHSRKHRFLQVYVDTEQLEELLVTLSAEKYIKQVERCHLQELDTNFVGNLFRELPNKLEKN